MRNGFRRRPRASAGTSLATAVPPRHWRLRLTGVQSKREDNLECRRAHEVALFAYRYEDDVVFDVVWDIHQASSFQPAVVVCTAGRVDRVCRAAHMNADLFATDPPSAAETDRCPWRS